MKTKSGAALNKLQTTISIHSSSVSSVLSLPASPNHLSPFSLSIANWQQHFNSPCPSFLLSDELLAGDQRGVVPTVHYARHYLLAHMNTEAGEVPRGHRPAPGGHTAKRQRSARSCVCVCVYIDKLVLYVF